jgi:hypothetical protein
MDKNKLPFKQAGITGLCVGIFAISSFTIADALNTHFGWGFNPTTIRGVCGLLTILILGTGTYIGMQSIKRNNQGTLTYMEAISAGVLIAVTTGIITAICAFIYCTFINPGNTAYMVAESKKEMIARGETAAQIATHVADLQKQLSAAAQVMQALVAQSVIGTLISLVMGLFVRSKKVHV